MINNLKVSNTNSTEEEFDSFNDVFDLYKEDFPLPQVVKGT